MKLIRKNRLFWLFVGCMLLMLTCCNYEQCDNRLFPYYDYIHTDSLLFEKTKEKINYKGRIFCKYILKNSQDTLIGYWGIINDTVFFLSQDKYRNNNKEVFPMFSYNSKANDSFYFKTKSEFFSYLINIELINIENDTLYFIRHSCYPIGFSTTVYYTDTTSTNNSIKSVRTYIISKNRGVISYSFERFNEEIWFVEFPY